MKENLLNLMFVLVDIGTASISKVPSFVLVVEPEHRDKKPWKRNKRPEKRAAYVSAR